MEAITQSKKLLYVVGNELNAGEVDWFHASLKYSIIERLEDIYIVYNGVVPVVDLLQQIPLVISVCKPFKNSPYKITQQEANDKFWSELKQLLTQ